MNLNLKVPAIWALLATAALASSAAATTYNSCFMRYLMAFPHLSQLPPRIH
jgi:hypothetical protein